jgi:hypothetical protein
VKLERSWLAVAFATAILTAVACDDTPADSGTPACLAGVFSPGAIAGTHDYVAWADSGTRLLEGVLTIMGQSNQHVSGTWEIHLAAGADTANPNDIGPQIGTGDLIGVVQDTTVLIDLTPNFADNNVTLLGCVTAEGLAGTWSHVGIAGEIAHGPFATTKR